MSYAVAALYKFAPLPDAAALRPALEALCARLDVCGTLLVAPEGVNGTLAGAPDAIDDLLRELGGEALLGARFEGAEVKRSTAAERPFGRLKVKLKREIVTLGDPLADPARRTGARVAAEDWNALIGRGDVVLVDVRNRFEVAMGSFPGAIDPETARFSEFPRFAAERLSDAKDRTVAMFCTGGIRCEKASAHLLAQGFTDVRQLDGGVLRYLETVAPADSLWRGDCFVFDRRLALGEGLEERPREDVDV
ncbi:rhodanese-related sulfurtransferase [Methylopila musalis]|uniref:tRNA uridine(34) hydroxylase n=1 Tax=Methylopila musalis TaxID=1134781 RepID=A0ABW3ZBJ6_9HYPH